MGNGHPLCFISMKTCKKKVLQEQIIVNNVTASQVILGSALLVKKRHGENTLSQKEELKK